MGDREKGLVNKYQVSRYDGKPVGDCIVLEFKDPIARIGIAAFALAVSQDGYHALAKDLLMEVERYRSLSQ